VALQIQSTEPKLEKLLRAAAGDGVFSPVEFQVLRDQADKWAEQINVVVVQDFIKIADQLVEDMQKIALYVRKNKFPDEVRRYFRNAIEWEVAYVVAGFKSSVERL
jgi:hypothetical protein